MNDNRLVRSNRKRRKGLDRGPAIEPKTTFDISVLNQKTQKKQKKETVPDFVYEPMPTSMKIDTDLRDKINALSLVGVAETQKEVVEYLLNEIIDNLPEETRRKYDVQYEVLKDNTIKRLKERRKK